MASPRKVVSRTNTATSSAANFFQRGKKATTTNRVIANKNSTVLSVTPSQAEKPASTTQDKDQDDNQGSDDDRHVDDSWGEIDKDVLRELFLETALRSPKKELHRPVSSSSSSISKRSQEDHLAMKPLARLFSVVTTPPATPRNQSRARAITQTGVHQGDLSKEEKTLRQFDLASMYGPSLDLTRLERWERAFSLGLDPPQNIKHLLLEHTTLNTSLFTGRV